MKLADKLIYLRKDKRLTQAKLSEMMNVSRQAVSRWEVGDAVPSTENFKALSKIYDVPLEYLLHDEGQEPEKKEIIPREHSKRTQQENCFSTSKDSYLPGYHFYLCFCGCSYLFGSREQSRQASDKGNRKERY